MRLAVIALVAATAATGCDTMIQDRIIVHAPSATTPPAEAEAIVVAVREILTTAGLSQVHASYESEEWHWRDPGRPPGLHASIRRVPEGVTVRLAQDLHGPHGPTEKYRAVKASVSKAITQKFGSSKVRIE
jgi:hypothetical protein